MFTLTVCDNIVSHEDECASRIFRISVSGEMSGIAADGIAANGVAASETF
jgi:hypothetical protein